MHGQTTARTSQRRRYCDEIGLINRVIPPGQARAAAIELAREIAQLPQRSLRADRATAYARWSRDIGESPRIETERGAPAVAADARTGASGFAGGGDRGAARQ
jgi:enoyl-CoA hydratase